MQNNRKEIHVPGWLTPSGEQNYTSVVMRDASLSKFGIFQGDILIVEKCKPRPNDFVFAIANGQKVIRKLIEIDGKIYLQSLVPGIPITETRESLIWGKVTALIRENLNMVEFSQKERL